MDQARDVVEPVDRSHDRSRHYHVIENTVGHPQGYSDDLFRARREALEVARTRAHWQASMSGCRVETLLGHQGRYLITTGRSNDAGRMIAVEECEDGDCLEAAYDSMVDC
jgi:hypothetical protein